MGLSLRNGESAYQAGDAIWKKHLDPSLTIGSKYPSPHPPIVAVIFYPLSFMPLWLVGALWLLMSMVALYFAIKTICFEQAAPKIRIYEIMAFACLSVVGRHDLGLGQFSSTLFLLSTVSYFMLLKDRDCSAGSLLGFSLAIKFFAWPVVLFLILKKRFKAVLYAAITFLSCQLVTYLLFGEQIFKDYILNAAPKVSKLYSGSLSDLSIFSIVKRLSSNYTAELLRDGRLIVKLPEFSTALAIPSLTLGIILILSVVLINLRKSFANGLLGCLIISCFANPIGWQHYLFPCLLPLSLCWINYRSKKSSPVNLLPFFLLTLVFFVNLDFQSLSLFELFVESTNNIDIPYWINLVSVTQTMIVIYSALTLFQENQESLPSTAAN